MLALSTRIIATAIILTLLSAVSLQTQSRVVELNNAGWKAISRGDGTRAASLFAEALSISPEDPVLVLGAGAAAQVQGKTDLAIKRLKQALAIKPSLLEASRMLGAIAYNMGDLPLAVRTLEAALKYAPYDKELAADLAEWRNEANAHAGFEERRYDRFNVMYQGRQDEKLAAEAMRHLNSSFWRIGQKLGAYPTDPVVVILYTEKQFRDITRAPEWSNGQ